MTMTCWRSRRLIERLYSSELKGTQTLVKWFTTVLHVWHDDAVLRHTEAVVWWTDDTSGDGHVCMHFCLRIQVQMISLTLITDIIRYSWRFNWYVIARQLSSEAPVSPLQCWGRRWASIFDEGNCFCVAMFVLCLCVQIWLAAFLNAVRGCRGHHDNIDNFI